MLKPFAGVDRHHQTEPESQAWQALKRRHAAAPDPVIYYSEGAFQDYDFEN